MYTPSGSMSGTFNIYARRMILTATSTGFKIVSSVTINLAIEKIFLTLIKTEADYEFLFGYAFIWGVLFFSSLEMSK
jgi:hypothetical protein